MRTGGAIYRFGSFELRAEHRRLMRGLERIPVPDPQARMLLLFAHRPGEVLSIDALAHAGWDEPSVNDNTVVQALARLRQKLGRQPDGTPYFENVARRGYRFLAPIARDSTLHANVDIDALLAPYAAFVEGNAPTPCLRTRVRRQQPVH